MKLSTLDTVTKGLKSLKVSSLVPNKAFPYIVDEEYIPAWHAFLETKTAQDMFKQYKNKLGLYMNVLAFVSNILGVDKKATGKYKPDVTSQSLALLDFSNYAEHINNYLIKSRLLNYLRMTSHTVELTTKHRNTFINADVGFSLAGLMEFKPKGRHTLDGVLHEELKTTMFKSVPLELRSKLPNKNSAGKDNIRKFYDVPTLVNSKASWYTLLEDKNIKVDIARAKYSTLVIRYNITLFDIVFGEPKLIKNEILSLWHRSRKM